MANVLEDEIPEVIKYTIHSTEYNTVHIITQYTVHSIRYTVHSTQYTGHSTQYTGHSTQYTGHITQYTVHSTQYRYTVHSTHHTGHITQDTVHSTQNTVHSTQYTYKLTCPAVFTNVRYDIVGCAAFVRVYMFPGNHYQPLTYLI